MTSLRAQMPALANKTYFNYGGQGPLPVSSLAAITNAWATIQDLGPFTAKVWPFIGATTHALRERLADWCGVGSHRVAFTENVTSGCVLPLWGLPWAAGDELLLSDCEHPGVVAACRELARRHHLSITTLVVSNLRGSLADAAAAVAERLAAALTPRTRLVVLSHLLWNTGQVMPIAAVAAQLAGQARQPWLLVDAAQSLGSLRVDEAAAAADIYACTGHKWCCGPEGLGAVVVSERVLEESAPTLIGWRSLSDEAAAAAGFHRDARRFEVATSCLPLFAGLECSLRLLEAEGDAEQRLARIQERSGRLWRGVEGVSHLRPLLEVPPPAGLISFSVEGGGGVTPAGLVDELGARELWLRTLPDPDCVRACTHITTTEAEIDRLLDALLP